MKWMECMMSCQTGTILHLELEQSRSGWTCYCTVHFCGPFGTSSTSFLTPGVKLKQLFSSN